MLMGDTVNWFSTPKEASVHAIQHLLHLLETVDDPVHIRVVLASESSAQKLFQTVAGQSKYKERMHSLLSQDNNKQNVTVLFSLDAFYPDRGVVIYDGILPDLHIFEGCPRHVFACYDADHLLDLRTLPAHVVQVDHCDANTRLLHIALALLARRKVANHALVVARLHALCMEETNDIFPHCNSFELFFQACMIAKLQQHLAYDETCDVEFPDIVYQHEGDFHARPWSCRVLFINDRVWHTPEESALLSPRVEK